MLLADVLGLFCWTVTLSGAQVLTDISGGLEAGAGEQLRLVWKGAGVWWTVVMDIWTAQNSLEEHNHVLVWEVQNQVESNRN